MPKNTKPSLFRLVFRTILFLSLTTGGVALHLSSHETLNPQQERIFELATTTCQVGLFTIFGLLGGGATASSTMRKGSGQ